MPYFKYFTADPKLVFQKLVPGLAIVHLGSLIVISDMKMYTPFAVSEKNSNNFINDLEMINDEFRVEYLNYALDYGKMHFMADKMTYETVQSLGSIKELIAFDEFLKFQTLGSIKEAFNIVEELTERKYPVYFYDTCFYGRKHVLVMFIVKKNLYGAVIDKRICNIKLYDIVHHIMIAQKMQF